MSVNDTRRDRVYEFVALALVFNLVGLYEVVILLRGVNTGCHGRHVSWEAGLPKCEE